MSRPGNARQSGKRDVKALSTSLLFLQTTWTEFRSGFLEPSTTAFFSMLFGLAVGCGTLLWFFSPSTIATPVGKYLPRSSSDAAAFATRTALVLGSTPARSPRLLIFGASTVAQAISTGSVLSAEIQRLSGMYWDVHVLTTPVQSPLDQLALIEAALEKHNPEGPPVLIVLGVGLQRLGWNKERLSLYEDIARIGIRSVWVDEELVALGLRPRPRIGIYLLDNPRFVMGERIETVIRLALQRPVLQRVDIYSNGTPLNLDKRPSKAILSQIAAGQADASTYFGLHANLAERLNAYPGVHLALIEEPLAPDFLKARGLLDQQATMHHTLTDLTRTIGAVYWPIASEAGLATADYHDNRHLKRGQAQDRFQIALARHLSDFAKHLQIRQ